jgi:hypothetical protein
VEANSRFAAPREFFVVGYEHERCSMVALQFEQQCGDPFSRLGIQASRGLVSQKNSGLRSVGSRQPYPLLLAS